jgi:hypothetical protein
MNCRNRSFGRKIHFVPPKRSSSVLEHGGLSIHCLIPQIHRCSEGSWFPLSRNQEAPPYPSVYTHGIKVPFDSWKPWISENRVRTDDTVPSVFLPTSRRSSLLSLFGPLIIILCATSAIRRNSSPQKTRDLREKEEEVNSRIGRTLSRRLLLIHFVIS